MSKGIIDRIWELTQGATISDKNTIYAGEEELKELHKEAVNLAGTVVGIPMRSYKEFIKDLDRCRIYSMPIVQVNKPKYLSVAKPVNL